MWEYKVDRFAGPLAEQLLNLRGSDGWELCSVVQMGMQFAAYFKRPLA